LCLRNGARYPQRNEPSEVVRVGSKEITLSDFFADDPPQIDFGDGSLLIYSHLYSLPDDPSALPYDPSQIEIWDWTTVNIRRESQGLDKRQDSIQRLVIDRVLDDDQLQIVFDDDGAGEIADVVAFRIQEDIVTVTLWHCKYSASGQPGARLADLYEVCGQAQKSARWADRPNRMFDHMLRREKLRRDRGQASRLERGSPAQLRKLKARWQEYRYYFNVRIVQPGLSATTIAEEGLHLLASTEAYLVDTRQIPLRVIGSL
jgi:hypothetical protein